MTQPDRNDKAVIVVAGPTASGKSSLALDICERFGGEIVNADSMQVYRELPLLTARPGAADERRVRHHLYGVRTIRETCSAGAWLDMALDAIAGIRERGAVPVICGGTGLYIKVLMEGIAPVPDVSAEVTREAGRLFDAEGGDAFHARLALLDPDAAARLAPGDRQRLVRAYGVVRTSGRALGDWQAAQTAEPPLDARFLTVCLMPERAALYQRIEARFDAMVDAGALDEVANLAKLSPDPTAPAMKALGVPEFLRYLRGECTLPEAVEKAKQLTRNFAKRQFTWFRGQMSPDLTLDRFGDGALTDVEAALGDFLISESSC